MCRRWNTMPTPNGAQVVTMPTPLIPDAESEETHLLVERILRERQLIVASNRGPVTFERRADGSFGDRQGSGGLVTAVSAVLQDHQAIWIAASMTSGDRARAQAAADAGETLISPSGAGSQFKLRFVVP